jgi:5'-deoxynucleotidase YfbR-like HD superfamily hydrolase
MSDIISRLRDAEREVEEESVKFYQKALRYRSGNRVKRYHTVDAVVGETVGHHSANMAILCVLISEQKPTATLLMAALTHDMAEQFTGDIPATAKWDSPELKQALDKMEAKYDRHWFNTNVVSSYEQRVLKQADMLDLCFKASEEVRMGNYQFKPILNRGLVWLRTNDPLPATRQLMKEIANECQ